MKLVQQKTCLFLTRHDRGGVGAETITLAGIVALAGLVGFSSLGDGTRASIEGSTHGGAVSAHHAAVASQAGTAEAFLNAARGLYREVPSLLPFREGAGEPMLDVIRSLDAGEISAEQLGTRLGSPAAGQLVFDLHQELARLRSDGHLRTSWTRFGTGIDEPAGNYVLSALIELPGNGHASGPSQEIIKLFLARARAVMNAQGQPIPEGFLNRIDTASRIFRGGVDDFDAHRVFRAATAGELDDIVHYLGRYDVTARNPLTFANEYISDPKGALDSLSPEAKKYVSGEVIPYLQQTAKNAEDESVRLVSPDDEAEFVARLVHGDANGLSGLVDRMQAKVEENNLGDLPNELRQTAEFAPQLFEPSWQAERLRRFDSDEALSLLNVDSTDDLRARSEGGGVMADLVDGVTLQDFERSPARSPAAEKRALESLLRAVAQGDATAFDQASTALGEVLKEVPMLVTDTLRAVLEVFRNAE